ncbi:MAG: SCO family protein, partial [Bacteroidetes bacterium]
MILLTVAACQSKQEKLSRVNTLPYYSDATFTPQWLDPGSPAIDTLHQIPPFTLVNQDGDTITEADVAGKIYVVDFFFTTCPGICPKMTDNMVLVQDAFLDDDQVLIISHSVT